MSLSKNNAGEQKVFRDKIKEGRKNYYIEYQPADERYSLADLQLVFFQDSPNAETVARLMEQELKSWLKRFPVRVMTTAWDAKENAIKIPSKGGDSILWGCVNSQTGEVIQKWGIMKSCEDLSDKRTREDLARIYKGVPFRLQEEVRQKAQHEWRTTAMIANSFVLFIVVIPVLIEIIGLGVAWIGYTLSGISIVAGFFKIAQTVGWIRLSKRQQEKQEIERKKEHYFYHCERNLKGFNRLLTENIEKDALERTQKEAEKIASAKKV
jgi:hypothetical protein